MYRALANLDKGKGIITKGSVFMGEVISPAALEVLVERGLVAKVSAPPLAILPGWKGRAGKLAKKGIETVEDLVKAEPGVIEAVLHIKSDVAEALKAEALNFLRAPEPQG